MNTKEKQFREDSLKVMEMLQELYDNFIIISDTQIGDVPAFFATAKVAGTKRMILMLSSLMEKNSDFMHSAKVSLELVEIKRANENKKK